MEKKIGDVDKKIPEVTGLVTTTVLDTKIGEVEHQIPDTSALVTTTVLDTKIGEVQKKIPDVSGFVKKADYNTKISDFGKKYLTTFDYNKFAKEILDAKIKEKGLVDKSDISNLAKTSDLDAKLAARAKKADLKAEQDKTAKLQTFDSDYLW